MTFALDLFMITLMCLLTLCIVIGNKVRLSNLQEDIDKIKRKLDEKEDE